MSYCRLPIDFMLPCNKCDYYEGCKSYSNWEVDPDALRREFKQNFENRGDHNE